MSPEAVERALAMDRAWLDRLRANWLALADCAVFADLTSSRLGALGKLRRRVLETGERLRSLGADRGWIPHPRERLKNALASALGLREALDELRRASGAVDGGADRELFVAKLETLVDAVDERLAQFECAWAALLDTQYRDPAEGP